MGVGWRSCLLPPHLLCVRKQDDVVKSYHSTHFIFPLIRTQKTYRQLMFLDRKCLLTLSRKVGKQTQTMANAHNPCTWKPEEKKAVTSRPAWATMESLASLDYMVILYRVRICPQTNKRAKSAQTNKQKTTKHKQPNPTNIILLPCKLVPSSPIMFYLEESQGKYQCEIRFQL